VEKVLDKQIRHSGMEKWRRSSTSRFRTALMAPGEVPEQAQVRPLETYSRDFAE
jgi:hypothetical protein